MDRNTKSEVINAAFSPVRSLASFFARLNLFTRSGEPPINRMPNEIMQLIMAKLELHGDVTNLVRLRSVSTKWKALVEDYFSQKKSLIVMVEITKESDYHTNNNANYYDKAFYIGAMLIGVPWLPPALDRNLPVKLPEQKKKSKLQSKSFYLNLEKRFFGFAKLNNFSGLVLGAPRDKMSADCLRSLLAMFPNIVQLSISCFEPTLVPHLVDCISSLDSLTQLDLEGPFIPTLSYNARNSLSKLEHFSFNIAHLKYDYDYHHLVDRLEPSCVRIFFKGYFPNDQVRQWRNHNPNWLAKVTHLDICVEGTNEEYAQVVHHLSEHATSMKLLNLTFTNRSLEMTPTLIRDLSKLTNLAELELWNLSMDIRELTQTTAKHGLASLSSVLSCKLHDLHLFGDRPISGDQFTRALSVILPNLAQLDLAISNQHLTQQFQGEFEQRLNRFSKLRNHNINYF